MASTTGLAVRSLRVLRAAGGSVARGPQMTAAARTNRSIINTNRALSPFLRIRSFSTEAPGSQKAETAPEQQQQNQEATQKTNGNGNGTGNGNGNDVAKLQAKIAELEASNAELQKIKKDLEAKNLRLYADIDNVRKINLRDMEKTKKYALQPFAKDLIINIDNLQRALASVPAELVAETSPHKELKSLYEGVKMTRTELVKACEKHSLKEYVPVGEKFDPSLHMALFNIPDPTKPHGTIADVVETGYLLHDRVIRPARVGVVQNPQPATPPPASTTTSTTSDSASSSSSSNSSGSQS